MKNNALFAPSGCAGHGGIPGCRFDRDGAAAPSEEASVPFINHGAIRIGARTATA
jgi:hypothetical protein